MFISINWSARPFVLSTQTMRTVRMLRDRSRLDCVSVCANAPCEDDESSAVFCVSQSNHV